MRLKARMEELEKAMRQQRELLLQLDEGLVQGRFDNATYNEIRKTRLDHMAEAERELTQVRTELANAERKGEG